MQAFSPRIEARRHVAWLMWLAFLLPMAQVALAWLIAKPGITGLAQVAGYRGEFISGRDMADRVERDLQYIAAP